MSGIFHHLMAYVFDPFWKYVILLLHGNGTNGAQNNTFIDSSSNNYAITRSGAPTQGSVSPFGPNWSNSFTGTSSNYLSVANNTALQFGTGDFTVECWVYVNALAATSQGIICKWATNTGWELILAGTSSGTPNKFVFYIGSGAGGPANNIVTGTTSAVANTWYHLAFTRSSGTLNLFVNGVLETTATGNTSNFTETNIVRFGTESGTNLLLNGYISNARLLKGTALYTDTFTPPTAPLTAITNTSLLTCQSNYFKDNSTNNFAITSIGTPSVQRFSPFSMGSAYTTSLLGGSGYVFSGGNVLDTTVSGTAMNPNAVRTFTIEAWIYPSSANGAYASIITKGASTNRDWGIYINQASASARDIAFYFSPGVGDFTVVSAVGVITYDAWQHIAIVSNASAITIYLNGVSIKTGTQTQFNTSNPLGVHIGHFMDYTFASGTSQPFTGYISNLRYVSGVAVYTGAFTPPTSPLATTQSAGTNISAITGTQTAFLLNFVNGGIYDNAMINNLTTIGTAQISTTQSKFGGSSMYFNGGGNTLNAVDTPNLQLLTGNFTVEGWVYLIAANAAYGITGKGTVLVGWSVYISSTNKICFQYTTSNLNGATSLAAATWYHFAVVRSGTAAGNVKIYLNGILDATSGAAINDNFNQTSVFIVGASNYYGFALNGYIDDLRITKAARYTANFTPPRSQLLDY
jgi:hypothetical protein